MMTERRAAEKRARPERRDEEGRAKVRSEERTMACALGGGC